MQTSHILGMRVDPTNYRSASAFIREWAERRESRYVCVATVHQVMESYDSPEFRRVMNQADLVTPDGMPLVWGLQLTGNSGATRVYGPDLTLEVLAMAAARGLSVGFYGGSASTLERLVVVVRDRFPRLNVAYAFSPPFRPLADEEDRQVVASVNDSGVHIVFIGLDSPKQNFWMAAHKGRVSAVMIGVGAAFDFLAGVKPQAPRWMMKIGMEWFFRLITEPRRLWKRYLTHNPRFVVLFALQLIGWTRWPLGASCAPDSMAPECRK